MSKRLLGILLCLTTMLPAMTAAEAVLCGSVYNTADPTFTPGVYQLPLSTVSTFKLVGATPDVSEPIGGFYANDVYYAGKLNNTYSFYGALDLYPYSTETWEALSSIGLSGSPAAPVMASGFGVNSANGVIYGCATDYDRTNFYLYTYSTDIEEYNVEFTKVGNMQTQLGGMAVNTDGTLYGFSPSGKLFTVSTTDGTMTEVGNTGISILTNGEYVNYIHASAIFDANGKLYLAAGSADGTYSLYDVNPATGEATSIVTYPAGYVVSGLYLSQPAAEPGAPAAATELATDFKSGTLQGLVSFKAPTTTYSGEAMSGNISFRVLANGEKVAEGTVYTGVEKSVEVTVPERGSYEIKVICSNKVGDGPAAKIKAAIGYAAPAEPVVNVTLSESSFSCSANIQWDPVTTTVEGDPIVGDVTYKVVRYPDNKVIEENTSYTSCWDWSLDSDLHLWQYSVTAYCNDTPSTEGLSEIFAAGATNPPYSDSFADENAMYMYKLFDLDGDNETWQIYTGEARCRVGDNKDADDWMISPAINMTNGSYQVSIDTRVGSSDYPGKLEIRMGDSPKPEDMTTVVIPTTEVSNESHRTLTGIVTVDSYGVSKKYFGIHCVTEKGGWWIFVTNFKISAGFESSSPEAPTELKATSDSKGAKTVTLTFKAPAKTVGGSELTGLDKIEIKRDGTLIHTIETPTPGAEIEYVDADAEEGEHTYAVVATNQSGIGIEASATGYAGINLPAGVINAWARPTDQPGWVVIEWEPVDKFIDGSPMDPSLVTYNIYTNITGEDMKIQAGLTDTKTEFWIMEPTDEIPQMFWQFGVTAETSNGENMNGVLTDYISLGQPYSLPFEDTYPNVDTEYPSIQGGSDNYTYWDNASDKTFEDVKSQDGDNGMIVMYSQYKDSQAYFKTGLIDLGDAVNPFLTFYTFNLGDATLSDTNTLDVQIGLYADFSSVKTVTVGDFDKEGWNRVEIPLTDYVGKVIQVNLIGKINSHQYIHVDNFKVMDRTDHDIALKSVTAPERVKAGNAANISVDMANLGLKDISEMTVSLVRDGEVIESQKFSDIASDLRFNHQFQALHSVASPERTTYEVKIDYTADANTANNNSDEVEVITIYPNYPAVTDLTATYAETDNKNITLQWSQPDLTAAYSDDIVEDFESVAPWSTVGLPDWTFVDADVYPIYGFTFFDLPASAPQPNSLQSWWSLDASYEPMSSHFSDPGFYAAHSGTKYLGSMAVTSGAPDYIQKRTDDWAISPLLYGGSQTISFWAKSMLADALEEMEVLYSTSDNDIKNFKVLLSVNEVPWEWTQYFVTLPVGSKYFAIRNHSRDSYVLMIDDVNFTPLAQNEPLAISGYNVYRDGVKINSDLIKGTSFNEILTEAATPTYNVTAIYEKRGESSFSNDAVPTMTGIDEISAGQNVKIFSSPGAINVIGAEGIEISIFSIDGRLVSQTVATGHDCIEVISGVYIVRVGSKTQKLIVR